MATQIIEADIVKWLAGNQWLFQNEYLPKYHAVLCDPPYFLGSIVKRFGAKNAAPAKFGKDGSFGRVGRGFMGKTWDGFEDVWAYQEWVTEWATLLLSAVYPGAIGLFFGGTRTYHRLAAGLEDAGWEIVDSIAYMYGSGFPKSHNVDNGHGTALKPAYEPCVIARAPRDNYTFIQLFEQFGTGSLNIDDCRVEGGRWPANLLLSHSEGCTASECVEGCTAKAVGEQSGEVKAGGSLSGNEPSFSAGKNVLGRWERVGWQSHNDTGTAARFFYTSKPSTWEREAGVEIGNTHPAVKPISVTEYLAKLVLPPILDEPRRILVPFAGSGSEMIGAQLAGWDEVVGIEREHEYTAIATARLKWWSQFKTYEAARKTKEVKEPIIYKDMVIRQMEMFI